MKKTRKVVSTLVTMAMLGSIVAPVTAFAASNNRVDLVPTVDSDWNKTLGSTITLEEDDDYKGDFKGGTFELTLPAGAKWVKGSTTVAGDVYTDTANTTRAGNTYSTLPDSFFKNDQVLSLTMSAISDSVKESIKIKPAIEVDGLEGDLKVKVNGYETGITDGEYLLARVIDGDTIATALSVETIGETGPTGGIKIEESAVGSMYDSNGKVQKVEFKLPSDWKWNDADTIAKINFAGGFAGMDQAPEGTLAAVDAAGEWFAVSDGRTMTVSMIVPAHNSRGIMYVTPNISADDADYGDVEINVSGTNVDDADLVVAKYADFGVKMSVKEVKDLLSGVFDKETKEVTIEEEVPGTLVAGRKFTVAFPSWVKVTNVKGVTLDSNLGGGLEVSAISYDSTDNEVDFTIGKGSKGTVGKIKPTFELSIEADKSGDIEMTIDGKAGATGSLVVAKAIAPVSVAGSNKGQLRIGVKNQAVGDIIITENKDEALTKGGELKVKLPDNIEWSTDPKVEVIEGNLELDEDTVDTTDNYLTVKVKSESSKPSKIKISGIQVDIDRTVPEGAVFAKIQGSAVVHNDKGQKGYYHGTLDKTDATNAGKTDVLDAGEFDTTTVAKVQIADVVTPAPEAGTAIFNVGSSIYTAGGVTKVMDAAPYIKEGRTYVPVRYLALSLGVAEEDIAFENGVVTLTKGDTVLKLTIGSKQLDKNGAVTTMDVAPEVVNGRTMLPARFVAEGFGALVGFANGQVVISQ